MQPQTEGKLLPGYLSLGPELVEFECSEYSQDLFHHFNDLSKLSNLVGILFGLFKLVRLDEGMCSVKV